VEWGGGCARSGVSEGPGRDDELSQTASILQFRKSNKRQPQKKTHSAVGMGQKALDQKDNAQAEDGTGSRIRDPGLRRQDAGHNSANMHCTCSESYAEQENPEFGGLKLFS